MSSSAMRMRAFALALPVSHLPENATMPGIATRGQKDNPCCRYRTGKLCKSLPVAMRDCVLKHWSGFHGISGRGSLGTAAPGARPHRVRCCHPLHLCPNLALQDALLQTCKAQQRIGPQCAVEVPQVAAQTECAPQFHGMAHAILQC